MNDRTNGTPGTPSQPAEQPAPPAKQGGPASHARSGGSRAQERIAALGDAVPGPEGAAAADLEARLEAALKRAEDAEAGWQRARADFANLKRRVDEERSELASLAGDRLLSRVLELADDFDLAIEHVPEEARGTAWLEGIDAIDRKLRGLLEAEGVTPMGGEGEPFDPYTQQAISYEDRADLADGTVIRVLQRGYTVRDRVLRPALVAVARNDQPTTS
jgi:molecular chaperone GrpE